MTIIEKIPLSRSSERVKFDVGRDKFRCYSPSNPHYYMDSTGLTAIDLSYSKDETLPIDNCQIKNKNIRSVGIRKSNNPNKFIGIRPDYNQDGSQQLEFTIDDIILDGTSSTINVGNTDSVDSITTDLGDIVVRSTRQGTRQLIKSKNAETDFKIKYKLHLTGLDVQNNKTTYSNEVIRESTNPAIDAQHVGTLDSSSLVSAWVNDIEHIADSTSTDYIRSSYISYDHIIVGNDIDAFSIPSSWTKSQDATTLGFPEALYCKSSYMKDVFEVYMHKPSISIDKIRELYADFLSDLTGKTAELSLRNQSLIILDGTAAVGMWAICNDRDSLTIQIKLAHHEEVNYLWTDDVQHISSYIDTSASQVLQVWNDSFITAYEAALKSTSEIVINGEYYEPDTDGNFIITDATNNIVYYISKPKLIDDEFNIITDKTIHTLKDNGDDTYEYIKYPDAECISHDLIKDASYIDADIYYGSTADGYITVMAATFDEVRDATEGLAVTTNTNTFNQSVTAFLDKWQNMGRSFFMFDTSAIEGVVSACTMKIYGTTRAAGYLAGGVSCQQGSQGTSLALADYDAFSGTYFAYVASGSWNQSAYNSFKFNSAGRSGVNTTGTTQICCREYTHDYLDSALITDKTYYAEGMYYTDNTGTTKDPYLEIETGGPYKQSPTQRTCMFG